MTFWTSVREKTLKELWEQGLTAREISEKMGSTRNSIMGKARRMSLSARRGSADETKARKARKPRTHKRQRKSQAQPQSELADSPIEEVAPKSPPKKDEARPVTGPLRGKDLLSLGAHDCRYPTSENERLRRGDYLFCGQPKRPGSFFCSHHHGVCYRQPQDNLGGQGDFETLGNAISRVMNGIATNTQNKEAI